MLLAQHGWGKSDKIDQGINEGSIGGLILSPRDESPVNLAAYLTHIRAEYPDSERLVDPQFYVGTIWPVRDGRLEEYAHYRRHLDPTSFSPTEISNMVGATLNWQSGLETSAVLSPTVIVDDLRSRWAQIAFMLAQETVNQYGGEKTLTHKLSSKGRSTKAWRFCGRVAKQYHNLGSKRLLHDCDAQFRSI